MRLPLVLGLYLFPLMLAASEMQEIDPRLYSGTYLFEDGVRVSGGRFDEAGQQMLLFMDTEHSRRGAPLVRGENGFEPAFGLPGPVQVTFSDDGDRMHWLSVTGETLHARRVMQPGFRDATFSNGNVQLPLRAEQESPGVGARAKSAVARCYRP